MRQDSVKNGDDQCIKQNITQDRVQSWRMLKQQREGPIADYRIHRMRVTPERYDCRSSLMMSVARRPS